MTAPLLSRQRRAEIAARVNGGAVVSAAKEPLRPEQVRAQCIGWIEGKRTYLAGVHLEGGMLLAEAREAALAAHGGIAAAYAAEAKDLMERAQAYAAEIRETIAIRDRAKAMLAEVVARNPHDLADYTVMTALRVVLGEPVNAPAPGGADPTNNGDSRDANAKERA